MARIKIDLPLRFFDTTIRIPVRISDINYGNHVGNDSLVAIIHEARVQFLKQHGYTELDIEGTGLIMGDIAVEFKNESFYNDVIDVKIAAAEISAVSFELLYKLTTERNNEEALIARAKTTMVCYNYEMKKVAGIPASLLKILKG